MNEKKLNTESYKGVRDFYPEDQAIQIHIFTIWRNVVQKFGYEEYNASVLESAELYRAKSGEEIVNEQTYTFKDRGDREVTLRPEMTPTVARMVAARKRELAYPLRWFSIPNLFRYEQPQRGRLREHWQLNVDIFGVESIFAEVEIIQIAYEIMRGYGLSDTNFEIRINSRKIMNYILHDVFKLDEEKAYKVSKLIDRKNKMTETAFVDLMTEVMGEASPVFITLLNSKNLQEFTSHLPQTKEEHQGLKEIKEVINALEGLGIRNAVFDQTLMRGFDYYTGIVFEVFDTNPANRRSVFGGGRYDELLSIFGNEKVPAVGFGAGDVIARDLLETYNLLPKYISPITLYICPTSLQFTPLANEIAQECRNGRTHVAVDYSERKVGDKIKAATKLGAAYVLCIGEEETTTNTFKIKNLITREEKAFSRTDIKEIKELTF